MTTIAAMNPQTRDPLIRLPYETWLQCLSLAIYDSAEGPLPYLAVSPNWAETILSSPALWTRIIIDNSEDEEARLHTFLHLSASQLLDVAYREKAPVQSLQSLVQHRMRIGSLVISSTLAISSTTWETIPTQLWSSLGNPKMRQLAFEYWSRPDPIAHALIPACPNLRSLRANNNPIEESMIAEALEAASVSFQTLADLGGLFKCTRLHSLTVTRYRYNAKSIPEPEMRNYFLQPSSRLGPHLVHLEIGLSLQEFMALIPYIPSFVALYSATLTVTLPKEQLPFRIATPILKQGTLKLRMLTLRLHYYLSEFLMCSEYEYELQKHRDTVGHILEYLCEHQILQDLHTFHCRSETIHVEAARIASLLRCLSKARVLGLIFLGTNADIISTYPPVPMPNLLELSLKPIAWLTYIEAPNLLRLDFDFGISSIADKSVTPHLSEHFGGKISHLIVDKLISRAIEEAYSNGVGPKFESLQTVRIIDSLNTKWVIHMPRIRTLEFNQSEPLHLLLLDLLRHPGALPNLSTIIIRGYPCWELLFEVLRIRNTARMHRIHELVLPGVPILAILSRLVKLLQGHTDVYTNRDIDEVILKRRKDKSFTDTCRNCLSSGYINCLEPVSLDGLSSSPNGLVDLLTLEGIRPVDDHSKFQGWGDWETLMNEPVHNAILSGKIDPSKKLTCPRSRLGDAITISEYTLSGIPLTPASVV